jgi:hypothetical protein
LLLRGPLAALDYLLAEQADVRGRPTKGNQANMRNMVKTSQVAFKIMIMTYLTRNNWIFTNKSKFNQIS